METYEGVKKQCHLFSFLAPNEGERLAPRPDLFSPKENIPCTHWIEFWLGPIVGLVAVKTEIFLSLLGLQP